MITSKISDSIYPSVKICFSKKENSDLLVRIVSQYVDKNSEKLTTTGPVKRVLFTDAERDKIFSLVNIREETILNVVNQTDYIKSGTTPGNPFNVLMTLIIRYFKISKMQREMRAAILYLTLSMYPSLHTKYFKFEPNEQIMEYTVAHMSSKYKLKQSGTILAALSDTTLVSDEHYSKELIRGNDKDIADYILSFKTRLNGLMKNICAEFMKQHSEKNYINFEVDNTEDDEGYSVADSNSYLITRIADEVVMRLSVQGPNSTIILASARMADIALNDLRNTVTSICRESKNKEDIRSLVTSILYLFLFDGNNDKQDLTGNKFLLFCLDIYKKANTSDKNIINIKNILDKWLNEYSEGYKKTNRVATLNNFRKGLYIFFVFTIQRTKI